MFKKIATIFSCIIILAGCATNSNDLAPVFDESKKICIEESAILTNNSVLKCPTNQKECNGRCIPVTSKCCGNTACVTNQKCCNGNCIPVTSKCCGNTACVTNQKCCNGNCISVTSKCCGNTACVTNQKCCNGRCIPVTSTCR